MAESYSTSLPKLGHIARLRGFLLLNKELNPVAMHGLGALTNLIRSRFTASLYTMNRRPASIAGRDNIEDEEVGKRPQRRSYGGDEL
jgi:hypothetical protein